MFSCEPFRIQKQKMKDLRKKEDFFFFTFRFFILNFFPNHRFFAQVKTLTVRVKIRCERTSSAKVLEGIRLAGASLLLWCVTLRCWWMCEDNRTKDEVKIKFFFTFHFIFSKWVDRWRKKRITLSKEQKVARGYWIVFVQRRVLGNRDSCSY